MIPGTDLGGPGTTIHGFMIPGFTTLGTGLGVLGGLMILGTGHGDLGDLTILGTDLGGPGDLTDPTHGIQADITTPVRTQNQPTRVVTA